MDTLVQMLAELGVRRIQPLVSARTPDGRADAVVRRQARFERIAIEALKVNGGAWALDVVAAQAFEVVLRELAGSPAFLLDPDPQAPTLASIDLPAEQAGCALLLGPEGGFTAAEREQAEHAGVPAARLTETALRVETAAVAGAAVLLSR